MIYGPRSGSGRCILVVYIYPFYSLPGGVRRWMWHCGRGVRQPVGLGCLESQRPGGGAGDVVEGGTGGDAGAGL